MSKLAGGLKFHDTEKPVSTFDSAAGDAATKIAEDSLELKAIDSEIQMYRKQALFAVLQMSDDIVEGNLDDDELPSDRFDAYVMQADDGEDEVDVYTAQIISANMADAYATFGVSEEMITSIFSDNPEEADAAIEAASEIVSQNAPTDDDELAALALLFIFGEDNLESEFDGVVGKVVRKVNAMGQKIAYKAVKVIRHGKIAIINRRVNQAMKILKTAAQKAGIKKMQRKSNTGSALRKRERSMAKSKRVGLSD